MRAGLLLALLAAGGCDAVLRLQQVGPPMVPDAPPVDPNGLIAYYPFEDVLESPCALDVTGHGHDGACLGNTPVSFRGPLGRGNAINLDGATYIDVPHDDVLDPLNGFTVAVWVFPAKLDLDYACVVNRLLPGTDNSWQICVRSVTTYFLFGGVYQEPEPITSAAWWHLAITWDGQVTTFYTDGVQKYSAPSARPGYDTQGILIGADNDNGVSNFFQGAIDELYLFDRALSPDEILALATM